MYACTKDAGLGKNGYATDAVQLHFDVWVAVGVTQVGQMGPPRGIFSVALNDDGVFVKGLCQAKSCLGFLPGIEIVGLFAAEPVGKRTPDVCTD